MDNSIRGTSLIDSTKLLLIRLGFWTRRHVRGNAWELFFKPCARLSLSGPGGDISLEFESLGDYRVFREVFFTLAYKTDTQRGAVADIGAHVGYATAYFYLVHPVSHIHAVEPNPAAYARLEKLAKGKPRIHTYPYAVTGVDGPIELHISNALVFSSVLPREGETGTVPVTGRTLSTLFKETGVPTLMKVDIEGGEKYVLADPAARDVETIIGELHEDITGLTREQLLNSVADYRITTTPSGTGRYTFEARRH